jgi:dTDP-4-dehydrorhamnose 3,5-epimerase
MFQINSEHFGHFGGSVKVISPTQKFSDSRGAFYVDFREDDFRDLGLPYNFVQCNSTRSAKGVIRGLHFQLEPPMGKVLHVTSGRAYLVTVDIRRHSPTFLQWHGIEATAINRIQVWAPSGFARGYCALEDNTDVQYKCTGYFDAAGDDAIAYDDPDIRVDWPKVKLFGADWGPLLSARDRAAKTLRERGMLV